MDTGSRSGSGVRAGAGEARIREVARSLRERFQKVIPATWEEHFTLPYRLSAYEAVRIVEESTGASFERASEAVAAEIPELFAEYWEALPEP